jgi:hypothetical protein
VYITKQKKIDYIREQLSTNDKWAIRALERVFERQTWDEKVRADVEVYNNVGFRVMDAKILTSFHNFYKRNGYFTEKQMNYLKKRISHYANQVYSMYDQAKLEEQTKNYYKLY